MDRGQPERPADGSDDAIEAIEAVVAPAEDDVSDAPSEGGSSLEAPPPAFGPSGRPPAHWVAYIRARAPGLLGPAGGLAAPTARPPRDVVPHGPATYAAPSSSDDAGPPPRPAATSGAMGDADAPRWIGDQVEPWAADTGSSPRPGTAPGGDQPAAPARSGALPQGAGLPSVPDTPSMHHEEVTVGADASAGDDVTPAPSPAWSGQSTPEQSDARMPAFPRPDRTSYPRPAGSWPAFTAESHGSTDADASRPSSRESPSQVNPTNRTALGPERAARPTAGPTRWTFPPLPARSPAGSIAREAPPEGGWRVRATAPDTWRVARLDLPSWPDLPETMPESDEPDWRSIERWLQRATRLDREQRRR